MNNLMIQNFTNELFGNVRSIVDGNGNPWFVGADVARCLGYIDTDQAIRKHVDMEDKIFKDGGVVSTGASFPPQITFIDSMGRQQTQYPVWINESGLYSLIFGSKLPAAKEFKHWVTSIVLPSMRRIGFTRSMQLLQNEIQKLKETNKILYQANEHASGLSISKALLNLDYKLLVYNVITCPYLSDEVKIALLKFDITETNPEIDLDAIIEAYKTQHNI